MTASRLCVRIGHGFDVHAFGDGDHVMLGGVRVPHERGVLAHSERVREVLGTLHGVVVSDLRKKVRDLDLQVFRTSR